MDGERDNLHLLPPSCSASSNITTDSSIDDKTSSHSTNRNDGDTPLKRQERSWTNYEPNWLGLTNAAFDLNNETLEEPKIMDAEKSASMLNSTEPSIIDEEGIPEVSNSDFIIPLSIPFKEIQNQYCDAQTQTDKRRKSRWWILLLLLLLLLIGGAVIGLYFGSIWPNSPDADPNEITTSSKLLTAISSTLTTTTVFTTEITITEAATNEVSTADAPTTEKYFTNVHSSITNVPPTKVHITDMPSTEAATTNLDLHTTVTTSSLTTEVITTDVQTTEVPTTNEPTTEPTTSKTEVTTVSVSPTVVTLFPDLSDYCSKVSDGTYAHPHICRQFITCRNRETLIQTCAETTCYDVGLGVCVVCGVVDCGDRSPDEP